MSSSNAIKIVFSERLEGYFLGSKYGRTLTENISSTSGHRRTECVRPP